MPRYARIAAGIVVEVFDHPTNPHALFDPSWTWVECPSDTVGNASFDGEAFVNPPPPEPVDPPEPEPTLVNIPVPHFKMRLTPQERVAINNFAKDTENPNSVYVADWLDITNDPRLEYVTLGDPNLAAAIGMLVSLALLTEARAAVILAP